MKLLAPTQQGAGPQEGFSAKWWDTMLRGGVEPSVRRRDSKGGRGVSKAKLLHKKKELRTPLTALKEGGGSCAGVNPLEGKRKSDARAYQGAYAGETGEERARPSLPSAETETGNRAGIGKSDDQRFEEE